MPTMGESPEAESVLTNIKPAEVSGVDMPAIGEPHMIVKNLSSNQLDENKSNSGTIYKRGDEAMPDKLDETQVSRPVMKAINKRMKNALESVAELQSIAKNLPATEDGSNEAPAFLVNMAKSVASEIRSLQPEHECKVNKRASAESVLSLHDITKRAEDIEKANAVSYVSRHQWVDVTQSISESMSTYIDAIEHDDDGPVMLQVGLEDVVDKSASELEALAGEEPAEETPAVVEEDTAEVAKSVKTEDSFDIRKAFDIVMKDIDEIKTTLKTETVAEQGDEAMADETGEAVVGETSATASEETGGDTSVDEGTNEAGSEVPAEADVSKDNGNDAVLKAIQALDQKFEKKFGDVEKSIGDVRELATASADKVDKALLKRTNSRGGTPDNTTKVTDTTKKDEGSFADILGIRS